MSELEGTCAQNTTRAKRLRVKAKNQTKLDEYLMEVVTENENEKDRVKPESSDASSRCDVLNSENLAMKKDLNVNCAEEMLAGKKGVLSTIEAQCDKLKGMCPKIPLCVICVHSYTHTLNIILLHYA